MITREAANSYVDNYGGINIAGIFNAGLNHSMYLRCVMKDIVEWKLFKFIAVRRGLTPGCWWIPHSLAKRIADHYETRLPKCGYVDTLETTQAPVGNAPVALQFRQQLGNTSGRYYLVLAYDYTHRPHQAGVVVA